MSGEGCFCVCFTANPRETGGRARDIVRGPHIQPESTPIMRADSER